MVVVWVLAMIFLVFWHHRRQGQLRRQRDSTLLHQQKTNNDNAENNDLSRRYRNPLFGDATENDYEKGYSKPLASTKRTNIEIQEKMREQREIVVWTA